MKKKYWWIFVGVALLGFMQYALRPWLQKKEADQTVNTILHHFENGNFTLVSDYWVTPLLIPPISKLNRYTLIESKAMLHQKNQKALYTLILDFDRGTALPSGKTWKIIMIKTADGWRVESFELQELP